MKDILLHDLGDTFTSVQGHDTSLSNQQQLISIRVYDSIDSIIQSLDLLYKI